MDKDGNKKAKKRNFCSNFVQMGCFTLFYAFITFILLDFYDSFSTHPLTALIIHVIVHVEQRKGIRVEDSERNRGTFKLPMLGNMWVADFNEWHFGRLRNA